MALPTGLWLWNFFSFQALISYYYLIFSNTQIENSIYKLSSVQQLDNYVVSANYRRHEQQEWKYIAKLFA